MRTFFLIDSELYLALFNFFLYLSNATDFFAPMVFPVNA